MGILPDWMIQRDVRITPFDEGKLKPGKLSSGLSSYGYDAAVGYRFQVYSPIGATEIDPKAFDPKSLVTEDLTPTHEWLSGRCGHCGYNQADWKENSPNTYCALTGKRNFIRIPPHSFALAETVEHVEIPRDVLCVVVGKSTYARCGIITPLTPLEPEWNGKVTIEISNTTPLPARIYAGEGIMQLLFFRTDGYREVHQSDIRRLIHPGEGRNPDWSEWEKEAMRSGTCRRSYADKKGRYQAQTGITHPTVDNGG